MVCFILCLVGLCDRPYGVVQERHSNGWGIVLLEIFIEWCLRDDLNGAIENFVLMMVGKVC